MIRVRGPENLDTLETRTYIARTRNGEGRYSEAERTAQEAYTALLRIAGTQDSRTVDALQQLGEALAHTGRYSEAALLFRDAIAKGADSSGQGNPFQLWYAFACVAAAADRPDESLRYLQDAIDRGYKEADRLTADDDLKSLHGNPRFQRVVSQLRQQARPH
jgi:tetratricopeptide (TPR) repeat protein